MINEITDEAEAVPRPLTDKEKAAVAKLEAAQQGKQAADAATFAPLHAVDAQVMDRIGNFKYTLFFTWRRAAPLPTTPPPPTGRHANDVDAYLESVLLPGEVSLTSIRAVAFKGLVGPSGQLKVGAPWLVAGHTTRPIPPCQALAHGINSILNLPPKLFALHF